MPKPSALRRQPLPLRGEAPPLKVVAAVAPELAATHSIELWDLPLRIFHWSLLAAVATAITTGILGGEWMPVHGKAGLAIVGLLVFRLSWGFLGSTHARFANFLPTPGQVLAYLRGRWQGVGHNPLGALSVLALLGLLGTQVGTGLFGNDEIAFTGPLASFVLEETSIKLTNWHHQLAPLLYGLLGLHVAAIAFYAIWKKDRLVKPMVTGRKRVRAEVKPPARARPAALVVSVALAVAAVTAASGIWVTSTPAPATAPSAATAAPAF